MASFVIQTGHKDPMKSCEEYKDPKFDCQKVIGHIKLFAYLHENYRKINLT